MDVLSKALNALKSPTDAPEGTTFVDQAEIPEENERPALTVVPPRKPKRWEDLAAEEPPPAVVAEVPAKVEEGPKWELRPIPAGEIDKWWPQVEEGVRIIIHKSKGYYDFLPQEVYTFLHRGNLTKSQLWICLLDNVFMGFSVTRELQEEWTGEPYLHIWLGYSIDPTVTKLFFRDIETIGKNLGCKRIRYASTRMGWDRKVPPGWDVKELTLVKELE